MSPSDPRAAEGPVPVSVVLPVLNEEANISGAVESVAWASEIIVVDSGSMDRTRERATLASANVQLVDFEFPGTGPRKKAWTLANHPFKNEWVLFLDADERVPPVLAAEIEASIKDPAAAGFYVDREFRFMGRSMRCFRPNWNMRLFRHRSASIEDLGLGAIEETGDNEIHEHFEVDGPAGFLENALLHDDYRGIGPWIDRHNRYASWEAHFYLKLRREPIGVGPARFLRLDPFKRKRVLRQLWVRIPARPALRFVVWYLLRGGFRDGRQGFVFCLLMSWYELLISLKLAELTASNGVGSASDRLPSQQLRSGN
jgi:glycosyltransferase involved in cell wall biosynthesis